MKPVVKQQTQFFNKPIGVTSIRTGAPEYWQNIAAQSEDRYRSAYQHLANKSKEAGAEAAMAIPTAELFVIDPDTQKPVALEPPKSFGLVGRQAYQNLVSRRFEESIQGELEAKAKEYVSKYPSSAEFNTQFAKHIQNMVAPSIDDTGEMSSYGRVIQELGTQYLASTTAAMKKKEAEVAKARLKRHNKMQRFINIRKSIEKGIEGDYTGALSTLDEEISRSYEEFMAGELPWTEYTALINQFDGLKALAQTKTLSEVYTNPANEKLKSKIRMAIRNPDFKKDLPETIQNQIEGVLMTRTPDQLISALDAIDKDAKDLFSDRLNIATNNFISEINPSTTADQINKFVLQLPEDLQSNARKDGHIEAITQKLHNSIGEAGDVAPLVNELKDRSFDPSDVPNLSSILGSDFVAALSRMTVAERNEIANGINDRQASLNAIRTQDQRNLKDIFEGLTQQLQYGPYSINGRIDGLNNLIKQINSSDYDNKKEKIEAARNAVAFGLLNDSSAIQVTPDELNDIRFAITSGQTSIEGSQSVKDLFTAMKFSYQINKSTVDGEFSRRIRDLNERVEKQTQDSIKQYRLDAVNGGYATTDDIKELDSQLFEGRTVSLPELLQNETVLGAAKKGYVLPTLANSIYNSALSGNPQLADLAITTFRDYKMAEAIVDGKSISFDVMRKAFSPEQYGMLNSALQSANYLNVSPAEFGVRLQSFGNENIFGYIKEDLGLAKNQSIGVALDNLGKDISPYYRSELESAILARKIMGIPVTENTLEAFVDEYTKSQNMTQDSLVISPSIDGKTTYGRFGWMTYGDAVAMGDSVVKTLSEAPQYQKLFTGGTVLDAALEIFSRVVPTFEIIDTLGKNPEQIMRLKDNEQRILALQKILGVEIYYQPVIESFQNGIPAYRAGYMSSDNIFTEFSINDQPIIVSPPTETKSSQLFIEYNKRLALLKNTGDDYSKIRNPDLKVALARQDVRIQQLRGAEQTLEDFKANPRLYKELTDLLNGTGVTLEEIIDGN